MADSSSPEPQDTAVPSALTSNFDAATAPGRTAPDRTAPDRIAPDRTAPGEAAGPDRATDAEQATNADQAAGAAVVKRAPVPGRKPLPDAVAIHLVAVPDAAPPYDDAPAARKRRPATSGDAADVRRVIAAMADASRASAGRAGQGQFAGHWPSQFAQVLAETLAGARPPSQLEPWTTRQTRRRISQLGPTLSTAHRPRIRRVIITSPTGGVLEMAVIVGLGARVRALAVRLERTPASPAGDPSDGCRTSPPDHPGWICTAIEAA